MRTFFEWKERIMKLMEQSRELAGKLEFDTAAETIAEIQEGFAKRELMVVAVGEARRGKSSLLNALLNEADTLFPVDINVCTNVVTIVRYGETERIVVTIGDSSVKEGVRQETITRAQIPDYVSEQGNPNNYKNIQSVYAEIPNDLLKEGIVFVDTPGVGSLNIEHAETTYGFLPNADILLFVSDTLSGLTESELDFLKNGYDFCKNIVFPLTKKDMNADYQVIADDNFQKIRSIVGIPEEEIDIIPVSSAAKLRYMKTGKKSMYVNSNFAEFENKIWTKIARSRADVLLLPYLSDLKAELEKMVSSIHTQYQMLSANRDQVSELLTTLEQEKERLKELQEDSADWMDQVNSFFYQKNIDVADNARAIQKEAQNILEQKISELDVKICAEEHYVPVIQEINDAINKQVYQIKRTLQDEVGTLITEIETKLELNLDVNQQALEKIKFTGAPLPEIAFAPKKKMDMIIKKGREISFSSMGAGMAGTIMGGVAGAVIGTLAFANPILGVQIGAALGTAAGTMVGGAKGCWDALSKYDQLDKNKVNKIISQYIADCAVDVKNILSLASMELKQELTKMLKKKMKLKMKQIQENVEKIQKNISAEKAEIPGRKSALEKQSKLVGTGLKLCDDVITEIRNQKETDGAADQAITDPVSEEAVSSVPEEKDSAAVSEEKNSVSASDEEPVTYNFL